MKIVFTAVVLALFAQATWADITPVPLPKKPNAINFVGSWRYHTSNHHVTGTCPLSAPTGGTLVIRRSGSTITLVFKSGTVCKPESLCHYTGAVKGDNLVFSNHAVVDNEGGNVTNAIRLSVYSATHAAGEVSSRYVHPQGFECHWTHNISLSRDKAE